MRGNNMPRSNTVELELNELTINKGNPPINPINNDGADSITNTILKMKSPKKDQDQNQNQAQNQNKNQGHGPVKDQQVYKIGPDLDTTVKILGFLDTKDLYRVRRTCRSLNVVVDKVKVKYIAANKTEAEVNFEEYRRLLDLQKTKKPILQKIEKT